MQTVSNWPEVTIPRERGIEHANVAVAAEEGADFGARVTIVGSSPPAIVAPMSGVDGAGAVVSAHRITLPDPPAAVRLDREDAPAQPVRRSSPPRVDLAQPAVTPRREAGAERPAKPPRIPEPERAEELDRELLQAAIRFGGRGV